MEKKITKKEMHALRQAALVEASLIDCLNILLSGDRKHDSDLKMVLTIYICSLPATFLHNIGSSELWDNYISKGYEQLLICADNRLPGFRRAVEDVLKDLDEMRTAQDRKDEEEKELKKAGKEQDTAQEEPADSTE